MSLPYCDEFMFFNDINNGEPRKTPHFDAQCEQTLANWFVRFALSWSKRERNRFFEIPHRMI